MSGTRCRISPVEPSIYTRTGESVLGVSRGMDLRARIPPERYCPLVARSNEAGSALIVERTTDTGTVATGRQSGTARVRSNTTATVAVPSMSTQNETTQRRVRSADRSRLSEFTTVRVVVPNVARPQTPVAWISNVFDNRYSRHRSSTMEIPAGRHRQDACVLGSSQTPWVWQHSPQAASSIPARSRSLCENRLPTTNPISASGSPIPLGVRDINDG